MVANVLYLLITKEKRIYNIIQYSGSFNKFTDPLRVEEDGTNRAYFEFGIHLWHVISK